MLRRLHTRIVGLGAIGTLTPSPPAELFLKSLPPPQEVDPDKYRRFAREEAQGAVATPSPSATAAAAVSAPEPFYDIVAGAAGHKHFVLLTREGNLITAGDNHYGQTAAPITRDDAGGEEAERGVGSGSGGAGLCGTQSEDWAPLYVDLDDAFPRRPGCTNRVVCGSNYSIVYQQGGRRAIAFGNNGTGQLGAGAKQAVSSDKGFFEWDPTAAWWPSRRESVLERVTCGYNHALVQLSCGSLFAFGSNTWGELGIGTTTSPMQPERIRFFENKGVEVKKVAVGNSFTLFLTTDGRVYGCGATNHGQLPLNAFDPVPVPLTRVFQKDAHGNTVPTVAPDACKRLIRITDVACVGSLAVYLSSKGELLLQGSLPEYGVHIPSPRFVVLDQTSVIAALSQQPGAPQDGFAVDELIPGPSTLLVRYRNGCVAAMGANTEGQLRSVLKTVRRTTVNVAPAFTAAELFPMFVPSVAARQGDNRWRRSWFTSGKGFTLLVDRDEAYPINELGKPIELPPPGAVAPASRQQQLKSALR